MRVLNWWRRRGDVPSDRLEQTAWERGRSEAFRHPGVQKGVGAVAAVLTAIAGKVSTEGLDWEVAVAITVVGTVLAIAVSPVLCFYGWAGAVALRAPTRQRDEAREQLRAEREQAENQRISLEAERDLARREAITTAEQAEKRGRDAHRTAALYLMLAKLQPLAERADRVADDLLAARTALTSAAASGVDSWTQDGLETAHMQATDRFEVWKMNVDEAIGASGERRLLREFRETQSLAEPDDRVRAATAKVKAWASPDCDLYPELEPLSR